MNNCTNHGYERICERVKISHKSANRLINTVLEKGKCADDYKSFEKYYLQDASKNGCFALTYNNYLFIMNQFYQCVTVFHLPIWFGKNIKNKLKKRNKL